MTVQQAVYAPEQQANQVTIQSDHDMQNLLFNHQAMTQLHQLATVMAGGKSTVPQHLQGNPADCMAIIMQAAQWRMNPFAVAQKTHLVKGILGYEAQLVNAVITTMAPTTGRIQYEWYGPWENVIGKFVTKKGNNGDYMAPGWTPADEQGCGVRVWATLKGEQHPRILDLLLTQAQVRNSTLWASDPKQQLAYLGVKRWARLYVPDVILGVYTADEAEQFGDSAGERDITPQPEAPVQQQAPAAKAAPERAKSKLAEKRQQAAQQQGQVIGHPAASEQQQPTYADFAGRLHQAATPEEATAEWELVMGSDLPDGQKRELYQVYGNRFKDLTGQA